VPIVAGARLSGKLNQDWRIGAMNMQTRGLESLGLAGQNYTVLAVQRRVFERSNVGLIAVNRQSTEGPDSALLDYNRIIGADFNLFSDNSKWFGKLFYHQSFRPNQPSDAAATAMWLRYTTPAIRFDYNHEYIGENYTADVGFVPRRNVIRFEPNMNLYLYPDESIINQHGPSFYGNQYLNKDFEFLDNTLRPGYVVNFQNSASLNGSYEYTFIRLRNPFDPTNTGGEQLPIDEYEWHRVNLGFSSNYRKRFNWSAEGSYGGYYNGERLTLSGEVSWRLQPYAILSASITQNEIWLPEPYTTTSLTLLSPSFDFTFRNNLFLTVFLQYNTQQNNTNINARFQWRFLPMSDVFIVLTENYFADEFAVKNRQVVVKVNYWFQP
jgi:hypothetical protein